MLKEIKAVNKVVGILNGREEIPTLSFGVIHPACHQSTQATAANLQYVGFFCAGRAG